MLGFGTYWMDCEPIGPITLFDKSFLQSLSLDESVWFEAFFMPVICPIFYVETLADLAKSPKNRTAESEVRIIAQKTPVLSGGPCMFHQALAAHNLLGAGVPMNGRIPRPEGRYVKGGGRTGVVYDQSPEMKAYGRWRDDQFLDVEREFAAGWRTTLEEADMDGIAKGLRKMGVDGKTCTSLEQAKNMAQAFVQSSTERMERLGTAVEFFEIPRRHHGTLIERWKNRGEPTLANFAPYAAHVLMVEMFFHLAIAARLISPDRPSNRTDIAYLFYVPFCKMFVSSDKLHRRTASLFLRANQEFVWGVDLKGDLKRLNRYFSALPAEEREQGVMRMARHPPMEGGFLTTALWRKLMPNKAFSGRDHANRMDPATSRKLVENLTAFTKGETISESHMKQIGGEPEAMAIKHLVPRRKGSWYLLPKDFPEPAED